MKKIALILFLIIWTIYISSGIIKNYMHYSLLDWCIIIPFSISPYIVVYFIRKKSKNKNKTPEPNIVTALTDISAKNCSNHSDSMLENEPLSINPLSDTNDGIITDEMVPQLVEMGMTLVLQDIQKRNILLNRNPNDEEKSFQFEENHFDDIQKYTKNFESLADLALNTKDLEKQIDLLEKTIYEYEKSKKWFYRTRGGTVYFQDRYECLHNSKNPCFSYIDYFKNYLVESIKERDILIPKIIELASDENGVLQKDLYKYFDESKGFIQRVVKNLEAQGKILKKKKGSTYLITVNQ